MPTTPTRRYPVLKYLAVENSYISDIESILRRAASDLDKRIASITGEGVGAKMSRVQLMAQKAAINEHLKQDWSDMTKAIDAGQRQAAAAASKVVSRYEGLLLEQVVKPSDLADLAQSEALRASQGIRAVIDRQTVGYEPLSKNVYRTRQLSSGLVDNAVNSALAQGMTAQQFAKSVRDLISPAVPGGVSYAAKRLARTEINNAFHVATNKRYAESGIVELVKWNLSSSHPEGDICDSLVSDGPYAVEDIPKKPHPQCLCFTTPELPEPDVFINKLMNKDYGDEPWFPLAKVPLSV